MTEKLLDPQIRELVRATHRDLPPLSIVLEEFTIPCLGRGGMVIADVVAVQRDQLEVVEIKSDGDSIGARFRHQVEAYNGVASKVWLAVGPKLIVEAMREIPEWWGVYAIEPGDAAVFVEREAAANPEPSRRWLLSMFWRKELAAAWSNYGHGKPGKMTKAALGMRLEEQLDVPTIRALMHENFLVRKWWDRRLTRDKRLTIIGERRTITG